MNFNSIAPPVLASPSFAIPNYYRFLSDNSSSQTSYDSLTISPVTPHLAAVQLLDPYIGGTVYEGAPFQSVVEDFLLFLKTIQNESYGKNLDEISALFEQCLQIEKEIGKIKIKVNGEFNLSSLTALSKNLEQQARALPIGEKLVFPGGWTTRTLEGHSILYCIEKTSEATFKLLLFNSGAGIQYHPGYVDAHSHAHHQCYIEINSIPLDNLSEKIFQAFIELRVVPPACYEADPSESLIYNNVIYALGGEPKPPIDPTKYYAFYIKPQRSGTCAIKSILTAFRYFILSACLTKQELQEDLLKTYKLIRFEHKKFVLNRMWKDCFCDNAQWNRENHKIITLGSRLLGRASQKLFNKQGVNREVFNATVSNLVEIHISLNIKKREFENSINDKTYDFPSELGLEADNGYKLFFSKQSMALPKNRIEYSSHESHYRIKEGLLLPRVPEKVTPANIIDFLKIWIKLNSQDKDTFTSTEKAQISQSATESLRALPLPKNEKEDGFWSQIPLQDIEDCLKALFIMGRYLTSGKKDIPQTPSAFIEMNIALAIAETLARRIPDCKLEEYKLPYHQILRFATNPCVLLINPIDHTRLDELLLYAGFKVRGGTPSKRQNKGGDSLFTLHPPTFKIDLEAVEEVQEWKYYSQFLWTKTVSSNLLENLKINSSIQEKIAHLAVLSSLSNDLLPKIVIYLRNLAYMAQIADPTQQRVLKNDEWTFSTNYELVIRPVEEHYLINTKAFISKKCMNLCYYFHHSDVIQKLQFEICEHKTLEFFKIYSPQESTFTKNENMSVLQQNEIMSRSIVEAEREYSILTINTFDQPVRILSYLQSVSNRENLLLEDKLNLISGLFRKDCLLHQIQHEPRFAIHLINYIDHKLEYHFFMKEWSNCLFFAELGNRCSDFIRWAKKNNPERFKNVSIASTDYREWLLQKMLPHIKKDPWIHTQFCNILFSFYQSKQDMELQIKQNKVIDWLCNEIIGTVTIEWDNPWMKIQRSLWRKNMSKKMLNILRTERDLIPIILNQTIKILKGIEVTEPWKGNYPVFNSGPFTVDVENKRITTKDSFQGQLPIYLESKSSLFGRLKNIILHGEASYSIEAKYGTFEIKIVKNTCGITKIIDNKRFRYGSLVCKYFQENDLDFWFRRTAKGTLGLLMKGSRISYFLDFDNKDKLLCISDKENRSRKLVSPWHLESYRKTFGTFLDLDKIRCWAKKESPTKLYLIEMPNFGLSFEFLEDVKRKLRLFSKDIMGFYLAERQLELNSMRWFPYLVIENEKGDRKVIMRTLDWGWLFGKQTTEFKPDTSLYELDENTYFIYDLDNHNQPIPKNPEEALNLMYLYFLTGRFEKALRLVPACYSVNSYRKLDATAITTLLDFSVGGDQPLAVVCRLKLVVMLLDSKQKEKCLNINKNLEVYSPNEGLEKDYLTYLSNINNIPQNVLSLEEEVKIMSHLDHSHLKIKGRRFKFKGSPTSNRLISNPLKFPLKPISNFTENDIADFISSINVNNCINLYLFNLFPLQEYICMPIVSQMYSLALQGTQEEKKQLRQKICLSIHQIDHVWVYKWFVLLLVVLEKREGFPSFKALIKYQQKYNDRAALSEKYKRVAKKFNQNIQTSQVYHHLLQEVSLQAVGPPQFVSNANHQKKQDINIIPFSLGLQKVDEDWNHWIKAQALSKNAMGAWILKYKLKIKEKEKYILHLANELSPFADEIEAIQHLSSNNLKISLQDLLLLFKQGNAGEYFRKTGIGKKQIEKLDNEIGEWLIISTRLDQCARIFDILNECENSPDKEFMSKKLFREKSTTRSYLLDTEDVLLKRTFLVFEYSHRLLLRPIQIEKLNNIKTHPPRHNLAMELGTGTGKTKVILPLMQDIRRGSEGRLILNLWPESLYQVNKQDMQSYVYRSFQQRADIFEVHRNMIIDPYNLRQMYGNLILGITQKRQINTTPEALQSLELKFYEALNNPETTNLQIRYLQKILKTLAKSEGHIDESHFNLSPKRELNYTVGNPEYEPMESIEIIGKMFSFLMRGVPGSILNISEDKQRFVSKEAFDNKIARPLAEHMSTFFQNTNKEAFLDYVLGGKLKDWVMQHPKKNLIALIRGHLNLQNSLFYEFFQKSVNVGYGLSRLNKQLQYAKPYLGNDCPNEKADFELIYEAIDKTFLTHLHQGLNKEQLWNLIQFLQKEAINQSKQTLPRKKIKETEAFKFYEKHFFEIADMLAITKNSLELYHKELGRNSEIIIYYVCKLVAPTIRKYKKKFKSTSQNMRGMIGSFIALSATPGNPSSYVMNVASLMNPETAIKIRKAIISKTGSQESIHLVRSCKAHAILNEIIPLIKDPFRMLIDIGALFKGMSNERVAAALLDGLSKINPEIEGVVFFNEKDQLVILERQKEEPVMLARSTLPVNKRFTYCDQRHTFGTDIQMCSQAKGLATFDTFTTIEEMLQGVGRLRQFLEGQSAEWVLTLEAAKIMNEEKREGICIQDLLKRADSNQNKMNKDILYASIRNQMSNEIRQVLRDLLIHSENPVRLFIFLRNLLLEKREETPFLLFGQDSLSMHGGEALLEFRKNLTRQIEELQMIPSSTKKKLSIRLEKFDSYIVQLKNELPSEVSLHTVELGVSVETERSTENENQNDITTETNSQTENQNALENIVWGRYFDVCAWSKQLDLYSNKWLVPKDISTSYELKKVCLFKFHDLFNKFPGLPKPYQLLSNIKGTVLFTNNFFRFTAELVTEPLSENQKSIYEVLLIQDVEENKKKWTLIIGDLSTDAAFWRKKLEAVTSEISGKSKRRICLYDLVCGIVQDTPNQIQENEIHNDDDLQWMLILVKLFNGDVLFSERQANLLKQMDAQGLAEIKLFSEKARIWHEIKQSQYPNSILAAILES